MMIGNLYTFAKEHKYEIAYRGWNGLTAGAVALQLYRDPTASVAEYLPDIMLHSIEAFIPNSLPSPMMIGLNLLRGAQAGNAFITGQALLPKFEQSNIPMGLHGTLPYFSMMSAPSTIPAPANATDILNHAMNVARHLKDLMASPRTEGLSDRSRTLLMSKKSATTAKPNHIPAATPQHRYETRSKTKTASM